MSKKIYILHENPEWFAPLENALQQINAPYEPWNVVEGITDLDSVPPEGVYFNRLSASSHTRDHRYAIEYGETLLAWLECHGRRVVNGRHTLTFETRKFDQYALLSKADIPVPKTIAAIGEKALIEAVQTLNTGRPFIVKPNRGGKGLGVQLFQAIEDLQQAIDQDQMDECRSLDGVFLVQDYIKGSLDEIIRCEFIGGRFHYAVKVDTSGGFELCPADACSIDDGRAIGEFCMTDQQEEKFQIIPGYQHPDIARYEAFLKDQQIDVAAIESLEDQDGTRYTYDINVNTNYNKGAETKTDNLSQGGAYDQLARYLLEQLDEK